MFVCFRVCVIDKDWEKVGERVSWGSGSDLDSVYVFQINLPQGHEDVLL